MKIFSASFVIGTFVVLVNSGCVAVVFEPYPDAAQGQGGAGGTAITDNTGGSTGSGGEQFYADAGADVGADAGAADAGAADATLDDTGTDVDQDSGPIVPSPSAQGQLVITEIMYDSKSATPPLGGTPDDAGEWVELYNTTANALDIFGCALADTSHQDVITRHVIVEPGTAITLARNNPGFAADYTYQTVKFGDGGDAAKFFCGTASIDSVSFLPANGFMLMQGFSLSLDPAHYNAVDNDVAVNWCAGKTAYHINDFGSPGLLNPSCL